MSERSALRGGPRSQAPEEGVSNMSLTTTPPVRASTFYTIDAVGEITNAETIVVAGKTYTFQATLTDVDGNVHIGADIAATRSNFIAAINLSNEGESAVGAGTDYAASMTRNAEVHAYEIGVFVVIRAHAPGAQGNRIPCTVGTSGVTLDNATLENGAGSLAVWAEELIAQNQLNSEVLSHLSILTPAVDGE